jgi:hypothetical protein
LGVRIAIAVVVVRQFPEGFEVFAYQGRNSEIAARGAKTSVVVDFVGDAYGDIAHVLGVSIWIVRRGRVILCKTAVSDFKAAAFHA